MRIIELTASTAGGIRSHLFDVLTVASKTHRTLLLGPPEVCAAARARGIRVRTRDLMIADRPARTDLAALATIRYWARDADVVHAHTLRAGALAVLACATLADPPRVVVTLHNMPVGSALVRALGAALFKIVSAGADRVLGVSPDIVARAAALGASAALAVVPAPAGGGVARFAPAAAPRLLTVGRLSHQKGLDLMLDAVAILAPRFPALTWEVAGDGPLRAGLEAEIARRDLPVRLLGRRADVPDLIRAATAVVQTSRWEGQPVAVQEALHAGAALVATDVGGTGVVVGDAIALVAPDPAAIAADVTHLLTDPAALTARRDAARMRACALPTTAHLAAQLTNELRLFPPL